MWFDTGNALEVPDDAASEPLAGAFEDVPTLLELVHGVGLAQQGDTETTVAACELVLEALVGRRKISRSDAGRYGRAQPPERRRPNDLFGSGGMTA
jgi:magnesium chelatase subunit I